VRLDRQRVSTPLSPAPVTEAGQDELPAYVSNGAGWSASARDIADGFSLTGFFLSRHVLEPRGMTLPDARAHFIQAVCRTLPGAA